MRILCLSDTHGFLPELDLTGIDLVLHAGDMTFENKYNYALQRKYFDRQFCPWVEKIEKICPIYFTWGNHEMFSEKLPSTYNHVTNYHLLRDNFTTIEDKNGKEYKIYGTAAQPIFMDWAWNFPDDEENLGHRYSFIPDDVDILLTHCPAYGVLDLTKDGENVGSYMLSERIGQLKKLKLHVMGHIHNAYGSFGFPDMITVNACICDEDYNPINRPIIIEI